MIARHLAFALAILTSLTGVIPLPARAEPAVIVFAASSLKLALDEVSTEFEQASGHHVSLSYGGSSALARQIEYGAPAQVFLSANPDWMDFLQSKSLLIPDSRVSLLTNRLVLIAAPGTKVEIPIEPGMDIITALAGERLAMALIDAVPAGIYGQAALRSLGVWDGVRGHIAQTDNVSAALRLVAAGEAKLGIVYATDASAATNVRLLGVFPADSHPPILYPAARLIDGDAAPSRAFFDFLQGSQARAVFTTHGFGVPDRGGS